VNDSVTISGQTVKVTAINGGRNVVDGDSERHCSQHECNRTPSRMRAGSATGNPPSTLVLDGTNTYTGDTVVNAGTLKPNKRHHGDSNRHRPSANVQVNGGATSAAAGTLDLNGLSVTINALNGSTNTVVGQVLNSVPSTASTLSVGNANATRHL